MHEFQIQFSLGSGKRMLTGYHPIQVHLTLDLRRDYLPQVKIVIPGESWDAKGENLLLDTPEGRLLNRRLANLRQRITAIYRQHETDDDLTVESITKAYASSEQSRSDRDGMCTFLRQYIEESDDGTSKTTIYRYNHIVKTV